MPEPLADAGVPPLMAATFIEYPYVPGVVGAPLIVITPSDVLTDTPAGAVDDEAVPVQVMVGIPVYVYVILVIAELSNVVALADVDDNANVAPTGTEASTAAAYSLDMYPMPLPTA